MDRQKKLQSQSQKAMSKKAGSIANSDAESTEDEDERPSKRRHIASSSFTGTLSQEASSSKVSRPEDQTFWNGELRQTATQFAEPRADGLPTFRLSEIIGQVQLTPLTSMDCSPLFLASEIRNGICYHFFLRLGFAVGVPVLRSLSARYPSRATGCKRASKYKKRSSSLD